MEVAMNVLLLHLPRTRQSYLGLFSMEEPLAHLFLGPVLRSRHKIRFIDLRVTPGLGRELGEFRPDAALVGVAPLSIGAADKVLTDLRDRFPGIRILLFPDSEYGNSHVEERPLDFVRPLADALAQPFFVTQLRKIVPEALAAWEEGGSPAGI